MYNKNYYEFWAIYCNNSYYSEGQTNDVQKIIYSIYHNDAIRTSFSNAGCTSSAHAKNGSWDSDSDSFSFNETIPLYETPDGKTSALNIINFTISVSGSSAYDNTWGRANMSYSITTNTGTTVTSGSLSAESKDGSAAQNKSQTVTLNLFSVDIGDATSITINISGNTSARAGTATDSQGRGSITISSIYADYIPIDI